MQTIRSPLPSKVTPVHRHRDIVCRSSFTVAGSIALTVSLVPLSVGIDALVDKATQRVVKRSNVEANGVRCYMASPDPIPEPVSPPVILLMHQLYGLQDREVEFCDALAERGYVAVAVDTFNGRASKWIPRVIGFALEKVFLPGKPDYGVPTVLSVLKWIQEQDGWHEGTPVGIVGFCYGGGASLRTAVAAPELFASVGVFYGSPPSPDAIRRLRCPVFAAYGSDDDQFPVSVLDAFEAQLRHLPGSSFLLLEGEGHAFVEDLDATQRPGAAQTAWHSYLAFLNATLPL